MAKLHAERVPAFISYSHDDRHVAGNAKELLAQFNFDAFLAHEDLSVSEEWRSRILDELRGCRLFVPLLSESFLRSKWAPQEIGYVVGRRNVVIAPLSLDGTRSFGFISHIQSPSVSSEGMTRELLVLPLTPRFPRQVLPALVEAAANAGSFRSAEEKMRALAPFFGRLTPEETEYLAAASVSNSQIWAAQLCREEYLPELIRLQRDNMQEKTLKALAFQVDHQRWYNGGKADDE